MLAVPLRLTADAEAVEDVAEISSSIEQCYRLIEWSLNITILIGIRAARHFQADAFTWMLNPSQRYAIQHDAHLERPMQAEVNLPKAFSVQNEDEFFPFQHLLARLNPSLMVAEIATGMHQNGGRTVFWGLAYLDGQTITRQDVEDALKEAGFDFKHGKIDTRHFIAEPAAAG